MADCCHPVQRNIYFVRGHEHRQRAKEANKMQMPWTSVQMSGGMRDCTTETVPTLNERFYQNGGKQTRYRPSPAQQQARRRKKKANPSNAWKEYHCRGQGQPGQPCKYPDRKYTSDYDISWKEQLTKNNPMKETRKPSFNPDGSIISYYNQRRTDMQPKSGAYRTSGWGSMSASANGPVMAALSTSSGPGSVKNAWG
jgi:hypothetical protein